MEYVGLNNRCQYVCRARWNLVSMKWTQCCMKFASLWRQNSQYTNLESISGFDLGEYGLYNPYNAPCFESKYWVDFRDKKSCLQSRVIPLSHQILNYNNTKSCYSGITHRSKLTHSFSNVCLYFFAQYKPFSLEF